MSNQKDIGQAFPALLLAAVLAAMIGALLAEPVCISLPSTASEETIQLAKLKLLAARPAGKRLISGLTQIKDGKSQKRIVREDSRYTPPNAFRTRTIQPEGPIQICADYTNADTGD